ncbi:Uncharacterised protein [Klebsiella pneumoniae]|nr:Uncharacterised protein [Klebsiella pneumoniae]
MSTTKGTAKHSVNQHRLPIKYPVLLRHIGIAFLLQCFAN